MKKILFLLLSSYLIQAIAQDENWITGGAGTNTPMNLFGLVCIRFEQDTINIVIKENNTFNKIVMERTNTSISNNSGNLLFYTNGLTIFHAQHDTMQGSKDFNTGVWFYYGHDYTLNFRQSVLILPHPTNSNLYYLFHKNPTLYGSTSYFQAEYLKYSVVDIVQDSGRGKMITKNVPIISDWLCGGYITACKHANGKDWWILSPKLLQNKYYRTLFTGDSIYNVDIQTIGPVGADFQQGMAIFTPDGTKYIISGQTVNSITVFDFDRCTGLLSNPRYFTVLPPVVESTWGSIAVSPNSRYLYLSSRSNILQYDLLADDILASEQVVATYDGYICTYPNDNTPYGNARFFMPQLAPNGKIYICSYGATDVYTVINQPDSAGMACDVQQHAIDFNKDVSVSIPNFPNYRLGASASPCYGVDKEEGISNKEISVYPNPAQRLISFDFGESLSEDAYLQVYNLQGQLLIEKVLKAGLGKYELVVANLPKGLYLYQVQGNANFVGKFVKE